MVILRFFTLFLDGDRFKHGRFFSYIFLSIYRTLLMIMACLSVANLAQMFAFYPFLYHYSLNSSFKSSSQSVHLYSTSG